MSHFVEYSHLEFREELVRQLSGIEATEEVPTFDKAVFPPHQSYLTAHVPVAVDGRFNCRVCFLTQREASGKPKQVKTSWRCSIAVCVKVYLCVKLDRNCFARWHSAEFNNKRH